MPVRRLFRFRLRRVAFCVWCAGAALAAALLWRHHLAGSLKSRKTQHHAVLDWVEIEKQRGVSVTSSVFQFNYNGFQVENEHFSNQETLSIA